MCVAVEVGCNWRAKVFVNASVMGCGQVHGWWGGDGGCMRHSMAVPDKLTQCVYRRVYRQEGTKLQLKAGLGMGRARASEVDGQKGRGQVRRSEVGGLYRWRGIRLVGVA